MELTAKMQQLRRGPVAPPIDLEHGALDVMTAYKIVGFALACIAITIAGAALVGWAFADREGRGLALAAGALVSLVAVVAGGVVLGLSARSWLAHQARLEAWHIAAIESYVKQSGVVETEEITEYSFVATNPLHVSWLALQVHGRVLAGDETPYSSRALRGPVLVAGRRVGELSKAQAEAVSRAFAALGLVQGRSEGYAGRWAAESVEDVLQIVAARWRA